MCRLSSVCLLSSSVTHAMWLNSMTYLTKYYACDGSLHGKFQPSSAKKIFSNLGLNRGGAKNVRFFSKNKSSYLKNGEAQDCCINQ